jgi:hypothetical protein
MTRPELRLLVAIFIGTRVLMAFLAEFPQTYTPTVPFLTGDLYAYHDWAQRILAGVGIYTHLPYPPGVYPPGVLPFILAPGLAKVALGLPYRAVFIAVMVVVDAVTLLGLARLSRRRNTRLGMWLWVIGLPLLGPLCWSHLDLVPALTTVWALVCLDAGRSAAAGAWLGYGAVAKVYPAFLLASAITIAAPRARLTAGAVVAAALFLVPTASVLPAVIDNVVFYHSPRGIQIDSTWSNLLLLAAQFGSDVTVVRRYGAFEVTSAAVPALKLLSTVLSVGVVVASCVLAYRRLERNDTVGIAALWFAVIGWLLLTGSVLSLQFLIWLLALGAGAAAIAGGGRFSAVLLLFSLALTQVIYFFLYRRLTWMFTDAVIVLTVRNVLLAVLAISATRAVWAGNGGCQDESSSDGGDARR